MDYVVPVPLSNWIYISIILVNFTCILLSVVLFYYENVVTTVMIEAGCDGGDASLIRSTDQQYFWSTHYFMMNKENFGFM